MSITKPLTNSGTCKPNFLNKPNLTKMCLFYDLRVAQEQSSVIHQYNLCIMLFLKPNTWMYLHVDYLLQVTPVKFM